MFYQRSLLYRLLDSFFRHKLIFIITTCIVSVLVGLAVFTKPKSFTGGYTVIEDSRILENPLSGSSPTSPDDINQSIDHLQSLISTPDFLPEALRNPDGTMIPLDIPIDTTNDTQMAAIRKVIDVEYSANDAFTVSMEYKDPNDLKAILGAVITTYINQTGEEKSAYFSQDVAFIQQQVDVYRDKLAASEQAITAFKTANADNLPTEQDAVQAQLVSYQQQAQDLQIQADSDTMKEQYLKSQISQVPQDIVASQTATDSPLETQLRTLQSNLTTDVVVKQMKVTHPEVISLKQQIARLMNTMAAMKQSGDPEMQGIKSIDTQPNPLYQSLQSEVVQIQIDQKALQAKRATILELLAKANVSAAKIPAAQLTYSNLERDYATNSASYNSLLARLGEAKINEQLNLRQATSAYTPLLTSPPESTQAFSKELIMFIGGVIVSIVLGLGLVVLSEWLDPALRDPSDAQRVLDLPVLANLPESAAMLRNDLHDKLLVGAASEIDVSKALPG